MILECCCVAINPIFVWLEFIKNKNQKNPITLEEHKGDEEMHCNAIQHDSNAYCMSLEIIFL